jgi:hypothetical protein
MQHERRTDAAPRRAPSAVANRSHDPRPRLYPAYVDPEEQQALLDAVDAAPWLSDLRRRVQHYGYRYDYTRKAPWLPP